jgi:hypothetical protein
MTVKKMRKVGIFLFVVLFVGVMSEPQAIAQKAWRPATEAELSALLPDRAPVEKEHIETEMRTATGITNGNGTFIAAVLLITAGYSADGKYSHFLVVQSPMRVGGVKLKAGNYAVGFERQGDVLLNVHFHDASTGALVGSAEAHKLTGPGPVLSFHIWPPAEKAMIQIGRFGIPYTLD